MDGSLSPELMALCEWASHEQDSRKLLELVRRINEILEEKEKKKTPSPDGQPPKSLSA